MSSSSSSSISSSPDNCTVCMDNRTKVNRAWSMLVAHHRHYHHCVSVWIIIIMALSISIKRTNLSIERYRLLRLQPNLLATDSTLTPMTLFWDISQTNYPNTKSVCSPHYCWEKYVAFQNLFLFKTFNDCASICSVLLLNGAAIPLNQLPHETRMTSKSDQEVRFQGLGKSRTCSALLSTEVNFLAAKFQVF